MTHSKKIKKQKLEIEIRKKEAKAEREKELKANPELLKNAKAEKDFANFIAKLDKQELALQKQLNVQDVKLAAAEQPDNIKLNAFLERKEYIKNEIAKIEAEIEEIARQEEEIWAEYRAAKAEAKRQKAEYKAQVKAEKETLLKTMMIEGILAIQAGESPALIERKLNAYVLDKHMNKAD